MSEPYIGEIRIFTYDFDPVRWMSCQGQLLPIQQYGTLFSVLGTTYGGDGTTTFALPNFNGRIPIHAGQSAGPGLSQRNIGARGGEEWVTLESKHLPPHSHALAALSGAANQTAPGPSTLLANSGGVPLYTSASGSMAVRGVTSTTGNTQRHDNRPPSVGLRFCIAYIGIYPSPA